MEECVVSLIVATIKVLVVIKISGITFKTLDQKNVKEPIGN